MKYFWIIFSGLIFVLSVLPCCEVAKKETAVSGQVISQSHHNESHEHEACSPFCVCSCCGCHGFSIEARQSIVLDVPSQGAVPYKITPYTFQFASKFEASIWQPPQLV